MLQQVLGKSSVVDVHLFVNALFASGNGPRVPRRLCVVVGRRALVDSQADRAMNIQRTMVDALNNDAAMMRVTSYTVLQSCFHHFTCMT